MLWSIGPFSLPGIFSSISLFGRVTLEGLGQAVLDGLPFAGVILASAVVFSVWDPRRVLLSAGGSPVLQRVRLALAIAVQTVPEMAQSLQNLARAHRWRGIRERRRIALPLLERTLETAVGLAGALWSRGLAEPTSASPHDGRVSEPIRVRDLTVPRRRLHTVTADFAPGQIHVISGPTGSGKTTVLEALAGLPEVLWLEEWSGVVETGQPPASIAFLPHHPGRLFVRETLLDDCVFALRRRGVSKAQALLEAHAALEEEGLTAFAARDPLTLSAGEQTRAALVLLSLTRPRLLLLDEPLATLDRHQRSWCVDFLHRLVEAHQTTVIVTDHHPSQWSEAVTLWKLAQGAIEPGAWVPEAVHIPVTASGGHDDEVVLEVVDLPIRAAGSDLCPPVSFTVRRGESVLLTGDNGVGKTTLLHALAEVGERGHVRCGGVDLADVPQRRRAPILALVPDDPSDFFVAETVAEELAYADRLWGVRPGTAELTLRSLLPASSETLLRDAATCHPRDLSRGQATALALAIHVVAKPRVAVLDEPTRGLDGPSREAVREVVRCLVETGMAVVAITHDDDLQSWRVDQHLELDDRGIHSVSRERVR